jgi:hypothetical protein
MRRIRRAPHGYPLLEMKSSWILGLLPLHGFLQVFEARGTRKGEGCAGRLWPARVSGRKRSAPRSSPVAVAATTL